MRKSILITGCSSGIGLCVAQGLRARGYMVFATARKPQDVERLRREGLTSFLLDLQDSASIREAVAQTLAATGGTLYALFNNGGFGQGGAVEDLSRAALREQFETNVFGWQELTNLVLPTMRRQGHGRILQNSSVLGFVSLRYRGAYNASKHAIEALSDTLRMELHGTNIHVCLIEPGPIVSKFRENGYAAFLRHIDTDRSAHREAYSRVKQRYEKRGPVQPFTLPPEAVLKKAIHALESRRPKARYRVTVPTHLFAYLRRILPGWVMDVLLRKVT